eukprot:m.46822 g.46822  ORF g.46822 m.46822 type:complete len:599 (-) comp15184_c0_seq8:4363-6159(-)
MNSQTIGEHPDVFAETHAPTGAHLDEQDVDMGHSGVDNPATQDIMNGLEQPSTDLQEGGHVMQVDDTVESTVLVGVQDIGGVPKKRGRPKGSSNKQKRTAHSGRAATLIKLFGGGTDGSNGPSLSLRADPNTFTAGDRFPSRDEVRIAVNKLNIDAKRLSKVIRSDKYGTTSICRTDDACAFRVTAKRRIFDIGPQGNAECWEIIERKNCPLKAYHTCTPNEKDMAKITDSIQGKMVAKKRKLMHHADGDMREHMVGEKDDNAQHMGHTLAEHHHHSSGEVDMAHHAVGHEADLEQHHHEAHHHHGMGDEGHLHHHHHGDAASEHEHQLHDHHAQHAAGEHDAAGLADPTDHAHLAHLEAPQEPTMHHAHAEQQQQEQQEQQEQQQQQQQLGELHAGEDEEGAGMGEQQDLHDPGNADQLSHTHQHMHDDTQHHHHAQLHDATQQHHDDQLHAQEQHGNMQHTSHHVDALQDPQHYAVDREADDARDHTVRDVLEEQADVQYQAMHEEHAHAHHDHDVMGTEQPHTDLHHHQVHVDVHQHVHYESLDMHAGVPMPDGGGRDATHTQAVHDAMPPHHHAHLLHGDDVDAMMAQHHAALG